MNMPFELQIALRYLLAKRRQVFISVISLVSTLGVTVGVMALVIALAIMTGLAAGAARPDSRAPRRTSTCGSAAASTTTAPRSRRLKQVPGVLGGAPAILGKALITSEPATMLRHHQGHRSGARTRRDRDRPRHDRRFAQRADAGVRRRAARHRHRPRPGQRARRVRSADTGDAGDAARAAHALWHDAAAAPPAGGRDLPARPARVRLRLRLRLARHGVATDRAGVDRSHRAARQRSLCGARNRRRHPGAARTATT